MTETVVEIENGRFIVFTPEKLDGTVQVGLIIQEAGDEFPYGLTPKQAVHISTALANAAMMADIENARRRDEKEHGTAR